MQSQAVSYSQSEEAAAEYVEAVVGTYRRTKLELWKDWEPAKVMMDLPHKSEFGLLLLDSACPVVFRVASVWSMECAHTHQLSVQEFPGRGGASSLVTRE